MPWPISTDEPRTPGPAPQQFGHESWTMNETDFPWLTDSDGMFHLCRLLSYKAK
jgi:hypothetical protein